VDELASDLEPATLAGGQVNRGHLSELLHLEMADELVDPATAFGLRDVPDETVNVHAGLDVQPLIETVLLLDDTDLRPNLATFGLQVTSEHGRAARRRGEEGREHLDRRGLPGAVRTEESEHLGARDVERYVIHRDLVAEVPREFIDADDLITCHDR